MMSMIPSVYSVTDCCMIMITFTKRYFINQNLPIQLNGHGQTFELVAIYISCFVIKEGNNFIGQIIHVDFEHMSAQNS